MSRNTNKLSPSASSIRISPLSGSNAVTNTSTISTNNQNQQGAGMKHVLIDNASAIPTTHNFMSNRSNNNDCSSASSIDSDCFYDNLDTTNTTTNTSLASHKKRSQVEVLNLENERAKGAKAARLQDAMSSPAFAKLDASTQERIREEWIKVVLS